MKISPYKIRFNICQSYEDKYSLSIYFDLSDTPMFQIRELKKNLYDLELSLNNDGSFSQRLIESTKVYRVTIRTELRPKEIKTLLVDVFLNNALCLLYMDYGVGFRFLSSAIIGNFYTEESNMEEF